MIGWEQIGIVYKVKEQSPPVKHQRNQRSAGEQTNWVRIRSKIK
jgi:hypothetical protein